MKIWGFQEAQKIIYYFLLSLDSITGLPGLIITPLKHFLKPNFFISSGIKSNFPAEIAPEVTIISVSEFFKFFKILIKFLRVVIFYNSTINNIKVQIFSKRFEIMVIGITHLPRQYTFRFITYYFVACRQKSYFWFYFNFNIF